MRRWRRRCRLFRRANLVVAMAYNAARTVSGEGGQRRARFPLLRGDSPVSVLIFAITTSSQRVDLRHRDFVLGQSSFRLEAGY